MRSLQTRLLIAVGVLALASELGVALALRTNTRREFLRFEDVERRASLTEMAGVMTRVAAALNGRCCQPDAVDQAAALLPRQLLLFVFDQSDTRVIARAGTPLATLDEIEAKVTGDVLTLHATRVNGPRREQLALQIRAKALEVRAADGRVVRLRGMAIPDADREARVDAFLGSLDRRLLLLTATMGAVALGLTWWLARSTVRPLANLRDAAAALGAGDLDRRVAEEGPAEVVALARGFNALASRLQDQHALRQQLTSDVAHELRTPLTALRCRLDSVIDGVAADPVRTCERLRDEVLHLSRLVDDLQDLALADARELVVQQQTVSVAPIVRAALETTGLIGRNTCHVDVPDALAVRGDPARLRQVVVNLLSNVRRHAPNDARIRITARAEGDQVLVEVHNSGSTIPADPDRIFERFYRADPSRQRETGGTGLGLAIVRQLIEAQGGRVHARNEGDGVTVGFVLPRAPC